MDLPPSIHALDEQLLRITGLPLLPTDPREVVAGDEEVREDWIRPTSDVFHDIRTHHGLEMQLRLIEKTHPEADVAHTDNQFQMTQTCRYRGRGGDRVR